jgi:pyruvate dehydrogenase E2 component (dihydrolipoamide acetyltransferase)
MSSIQRINRASNGVPVLGIHSLGLDARSWSELAIAEPIDRPFYSYDLKGHGQQVDVVANSFDEMVDDAQRMLLAMNTPSVHLIGHSLGGAIAASLAAKLAARSPDTIVSLTLVATPFEGLEVFRRRACAVDSGTMREVVSDTLARWFDNANTSRSFRYAKQSLEAMSPAGFDASWHALADFKGYSQWQDPLPPTLACSFQNDRSTPPDVGRAIAKALKDTSPAVRFQTISEAGHMGVLTHAKQLRSILVDYWREAEQTSERRVVQ